MFKIGDVYFVAHRNPALGGAASWDQIEAYVTGIGDPGLGTATHWMRPSSKRLPASSRTQLGDISNLDIYSPGPAAIADVEHCSSSTMKGSRPAGRTLRAALDWYNTRLPIIAARDEGS
jgi:hypothetical protein